MSNLIVIGAVAFGTYYLYKNYEITITAKNVNTEEINIIRL